MNVEVVSERAIDEWIDDIAERKKDLEMKVVQQDREDMSPYAFKPLHRGIPVLEHLLVVPLPPVEAIRGRQHVPELAHNLKRFRPAQMTVPANHVRDHERGTGRQRSLCLIEKVLEVQNVVQRLIGHGGGVLAGWTPGVQIAFHESQMIRNAGVCGGNTAALDHCGVQVNAFNHEIGFLMDEKMKSYFDFEVAIPGAQAYKAPLPGLRVVVSGCEVLAEQGVWAINIERQEDRPNVPIRPVMEDFRKAVHVHTAFVEPLFLRD
jgi:hypothetical protein